MHLAAAVPRHPFPGAALVLALVLVLAAPTAAQPPWPAVDAGELALALEKLRVVGSALYVAAHPDDENTALLAWLAKGRRVRTGYLSLTRGDGGQNLIGSERGAALGVIRSQELLAARRIDGAEQLFTRAIDFGYSKSAAETFTVWDREAVLADVVRAVRRFRPDVIITRFPPDERAGHGQHAAATLLAREAFAAAADPRRFGEQLAAGLAPWRPRRIFWNTWDPEAAGEAPVLTVEVGAYEPLLGRSYGEIAAAGRSQHKSQGFGAAARRGRLPAHLVLLGGDPPGSADPFAGIDLSWGRLSGGAAVGALLDEAVAAFRPQAPAAAVPPLARALGRLRRLPADPWLAVKEGEIAEAIRAASGLWLEAVAEGPEAVPGGEVAITVTALNRSPAALRLAAVELPFAAGSRRPDVALEEGRPAELTASVRLPPDLDPSQPYWLREPPAGGLYRVADPELIGRPEAPPPLAVRFTVETGGEELTFDVPVLHRRTDPVLGERYRPVEVVPPVTLRPVEELVVFPDGSPRSLEIAVEASGDGARGTLELTLPPGFSADPAALPFTLAPGERRTVTARVTPPPEPATGPLEAAAILDGAPAATGGRRYAGDRRVIDYPHIPIRTLFPPARSRLVRLRLATRGRDVGYVMGAGDAVPEVLRELGYAVTLLSDEELAEGELSRFDAVVTGVRAYNTRDRLAQLNGRLLDYVRRGGTLVVQYNTSRRLVLEDFAPYPLTLSRDRVTVEAAPVALLAAEHPLLTSPNRITAEDFAGWVQERGLYFPGSWDPRFETVIASSDPGEEPLPGGLLYARVGDGVYVYTGYSFFRQLPAGVPGALRLFANLVAGGRPADDPGRAPAPGPGDRPSR